MRPVRSTPDPATTWNYVVNDGARAERHFLFVAIEVCSCRRKHDYTSLFENKNKFAYLQDWQSPSL